MATTLPTIEIDADGNCRTLYADDLELQTIGRIVNVRRASHIRWDEDAQIFRVIDASTDREVYRNASRAACITWEIEHFSPGGIYDHGSKANQD